MTAGMPAWLVRAQALHRMARVRHWATNGTSIRLGPAAQAALTLPTPPTPRTQSTRSRPARSHRHVTGNTLGRAGRVPGLGSCPGLVHTVLEGARLEPAIISKHPPVPTNPHPHLFTELLPVEGAGVSHRT